MAWSEFGEKSLYGGEEAFYAFVAAQVKQRIGMLPSVYWHHLGNEDRDPDYVYWKRFHGFRGWTVKPLEEWRKSPEAGTHYFKELEIELGHKEPNDALLVDLGNGLMRHWEKSHASHALFLRVMGDTLAKREKGVVKEVAERMQRASVGEQEQETEVDSGKGQG
jgi:hypothetical protein